MKLNDYKHLKIGDKFTNCVNFYQVSYSSLYTIPIGTIFEVCDIISCHDERVSPKFPKTISGTKKDIGDHYIYYKFTFKNELLSGIFVSGSYNASNCDMYLREDNLVKLGI